MRTQSIASITLSILIILSFIACDGESGSAQSSSASNKNTTSIPKDSPENNPTKQVILAPVNFNNTDLNTAAGIKSTINKLIKSTAYGAKELKNYTDKTIPNYGKEFFVSSNGNNSNPGTINKPFATLEKARNTIRSYKKTNPLPDGGIVVWIRKGTYSFKKPFILDKQDSGEKNKPIVYRSYNNEKVRLIGGVKLNSNWFNPVTSKDLVWNRLDNNARKHIWVIDLKTHGITDLGTLNENGYKPTAPLELFEDDEALTLARWPDKGLTTYLPSLKDKKIHIYGDVTPNVTGTYIKQNSSYPLYKRNGLINGEQYYISRKESKNLASRRSWIITQNKNIVLWSFDTDGYNLPKEFSRTHNGSKGIISLIDSDDKQFGFAFTKKGLSDTSFKYSGNNPSHWKSTGDLWINGMLKYAWRNNHSKIKSIDSTNKIIYLKKKPVYGITKGKYKKAYYAYNILEELTVPGEYYIDRNTYKLYVWPKKDVENSNFIVSIDKNSVIKLSNASWIELNHLEIEISRGVVCKITGGEHNLITDSKLKFSGRNLLDISGKNNGITYSELTGAGEGAISLSGGKRSTLTPSNNFVINNSIHNDNRWIWTYRGAVNIKGVGNIVEHNDIHDFMHLAISFRGNNNKIQYNNIYNVATYTKDAGAIYSGRNWGWRGNKINYNFIHDIINNYGSSFISGVYLDDCLSGNEIIGNIFSNIDGRTIFVNGGRDNTIENNIFYNVVTAYTGSNYGIKYINNKPGDSFNLLEKLGKDKVNYKSQPWLSAYPRLAAMPNSWNQIKKGKWRYPEGNSFQNNIGASYLKWYQGPIKNNFQYYSHFDKKPIKGNDSRFAHIPFDKIGIIIK